MPENMNRFVLVCQQAFAFAVVGAVAAAATGVVELEITAPDRGSVGALLPDAAASVSEAPVKPRIRTVPLTKEKTGGPRGPATKSGRVEAKPQPIRVVSAPQKATGYATVGVTWKAGQELAEEDISVSVRTLRDGDWSQWQEMHYDPDHEPDPGSPEAQAAEERTVRAGTDAVVVGDVDDVQIRAVSKTGSTPEGMSLSIVDPGENLAQSEEEPAIDVAELSSATSTGATLAAGSTAPKPQIFSRAQWGADERMRDKGSLRYGEIHAGFVHHTVNANAYTKDEVPSILRGIYAYHTRSRGWSDVGYNFLVDRFGRIWEGRYGGVDRAVVGAHTLGYNDDAFAMSAVGNFDTVAPSQAMVDAYGALMAWKLGLHGIAADDTRQYVTSRNFQAINGHRDAGSTACPGRYLYERLPEIRRIAARLQKGSTTPPPTEPPPPTTPPSTPTAPAAERVLQSNLSGEPWPDLVVRDKETKHALFVRTAGQVAYLDPVTAAEGWSDMDLVAAPGDLDSDGKPDMLARAASSGKTSLFPGAGEGALSPAARSYTRFSRMDQLTGVGDLDGDGHNDLVARDRGTKSLMLFPGDGTGDFETARELSADWSGYDLTAGVADLDGDGRNDLVARSGETLYLVAGRRGGIAKPVALAGRWAGFDIIAGRGDATGDRLPDLVARVRSTGTTYIYPGDGAGALTPRIGGWTKYRWMRWLELSGNLVAGNKPDLAGVGAKNGALKVFPNSGRMNLGRTIDTGTVLDGIDLLLNVGDWNGDGRGDVMTRDGATGKLHFRAGLRRNRLADPVVAGTGWDSLSMVAPVGDLTGDGRPDLLARDGAGNDRIYPSDGTSGFTRSQLLELPARATGRVGLSHWDADATPDTAARRADGSLWLWSSKSRTSTLLVTGLRRYDWVRGLGDVDGDGRADVVARQRSNGSLYLLPGGRDGLGDRRLVGGGFGGYDFGG